MDSIGTLTSMAFQYGVPLEALGRKFAHQRFEPSGFNQNPEIRKRLFHHRLRVPVAGHAIHPGYRETHAPNRNQPELAMPGLLEEEKKTSQPARARTAIIGRHRHD